MAQDAVRAALFLDFDNVFSHLMQQDVEAAAAFVREPLRWIDWLERGADRPAEPGAAPPRRRILIRRCYLNPHAFAMVPGEDKPRYYSGFRRAFVAAGFQVVDCPPLTWGGKTSADMVMVMDILDTLAHPTRFDEFLVLSSDADFTPVLLRLRAHDRRTTLITLGLTAEAYRAAADSLVDFGTFVGDALGLGPEHRAAATADQDGLRAAILEEVRAILAASPERVPLARAAQIVQHRLGPRVMETDWAGAGGFRLLLAQAGDPRIALDPAQPGWIYDPTRHTPGAGGTPGETVAMVRRLHRELGTIPTVLEPQLAFIFDALVARLPIADPTVPRLRYDISDAGKAAGLFVSPGAVNAVMHRVGLGGFPWAAPPDAESPTRLRQAFRGNIHAQAQRQGVTLSPEEMALLDQWTGLAPKPEAAPEQPAAPEARETPPAQDFGPIEDAAAEAELSEPEGQWGPRVAESRPS